MRKEIRIRNQSKALARASTNSLQAVQDKVNKKFWRKRLLRSKKRIIRYSLLFANVAILITVVAFVAKSPSGSGAIRQSNIASNSSGVSNPLDQVSSADIAVHVARLTNMYQATSVVNNADTVNAEATLASSSGDTIIAKPQVVSTSLKSIKDLQKYTTASGDNVTSLAERFGITSDSIKWSNNLTSNNIPAGRELWIPPVNGIVHTVASGDTPDNLASKFRANKDAIIAFNDAEISGLKVGQQIVIPDGTKVTASVAVNTRSFAFGSSAVYGYNGYDFGWCTWWAAKRRADIGKPVPTNLGNACTWASRAVLAGISVGDTPASGAVIMTRSRCAGHVGFVETVNGDGSIWVSDMNSRGQVSPTNSAPAGGWNRVSWRLVPPSEFSRYKFIY